MILTAELCRPQIRLMYDALNYRIRSAIHNASCIIHHSFLFVFEAFHRIPGGRFVRLHRHRERGNSED